MNNFKKIVVLLLIMCMNCVTLSGCAPSAKSEEEIIADVKAEFLSEEYPDCSLVSFDIEKRATDSKNGTDTINAKMVIEKENGMAEGTLYLNINYKLYDNGWQLENCARDEEDTKGIFRAKSAVALTQEEAISQLEKQIGMGEITAISFSESTDLENGLQVCSLEFEEKHTYVTYTKRVDFQRDFNPFTGNWKEVLPANTDVISEDWDIEGTYSYDQGTGDYYEVILPDNNFEDEIPIEIEYTYEKREQTGNFSLWRPDKTNRTVKVHNYSQFEEVLTTQFFKDTDHMGGVTYGNNYFAYNVGNMGYSATTDCDEAIKYFVKYTDYNISCMFFFGADYIGVCEYDVWAVRDDYNKEYIYKVVELLTVN